MGAGKGGSGCRHHLLSSLVLERAAAVAVSVLLSSRMRVSLAAAAGIVLFRVTCVRRAGSGSAHCFCSPHACENARQWQRAFFVFGLLCLPLPPRRPRSRSCRHAGGIGSTSAGPHFSSV